MADEEQLGVVESVLEGDGRRPGLHLGDGAAGGELFLGQGREGDEQERGGNGSTEAHAVTWSSGEVGGRKRRKSGGGY